MHDSLAYVSGHPPPFLGWRLHPGQTSMVAVSCSLKCLERRQISGVRSAVGMGSLPNNIAVEVEAIFEIAE